nr:competence/damage-inducible protein CinA [Raoultella sp. NCTC 9187]
MGGKGVYTNPKSGDEGYAAAVGGGLQWKIGDSFRLFGEYYYSPDSLSSGIQSYQEANAGASWTVTRPLSIEAGYRYLNLAGKDGNKDIPLPMARTSASAPASDPRARYHAAPISCLPSPHLCVIVFPLIRLEFTMLNVEMLSTGDEVLHGQIVDTNAAWLADFFFNQGLPLTRRNTVGDDLDSLIAILRERSEHADVLIVNGGLGPTSDDLSALAAATAKGESLILHAGWLETMTRFFAERGRPMAESNRKQAEIPASAGDDQQPGGHRLRFCRSAQPLSDVFYPRRCRRNLR